jgi:hypothetical protein
MPCGYAVEGLGFFHISHDIVSKNEIDAPSAMIRVIEGELSAQSVVWLNFKGLSRETGGGRLRRPGLIRFGQCFLT